MTALALRAPMPEGAEAKPLRGMSWAGRWALISQDDESIFAARKLACIPFEAGFLELPLESRPERVIAVRAGVEEPLNGWSFVDGKLRLEVSAGDGSLLGFLVIRGQ